MGRSGIALPGGRRGEREHVEHQTLGRPGCGGQCRERSNDCGSTEETDPPSRAMIEAHKLESNCQLLRGAKSVFKLEGRATGTQGVKYDSDIPCVQVDFQFTSWGLVSRGTCQGNCADDGWRGYWTLSGSWPRREAPTIFIVRSAASCVDKRGAEKPRLRYDNELARGQFAQRTGGASERTSCRTRAEYGHTFKDRRGHRTWTHTLPGGCYHMQMVKQSISAS